MAIFRETQAADARLNAFYDLPNLQWHGTTLYDKKTYEAITGYSQPNIPVSMEGRYETINNSSTSTTLLNKDAAKQMVKNIDRLVLPSVTSATALNIRVAIPNNFSLTNHAYMNINRYGYSYIPEDNDVKNYPKAYFFRQ